MAVLQVDFDGNIEDLQDQLDDADLETEATVEGQAGGGAGGGQQQDQGLIGTATRGAIVGAILTVVGLLTPIKEILEGIRNFFLLTLAPVFTALRPIISAVRDALIGFNRFLAGDLSINDIIDNVADAIKGLVNDLAGTIDSSIGFLDIGTPFPEIGTQNQTERGGQRVRGEGEQGLADRASLIASGIQGNVPALTAQFAQNYVADRTDEAQKDRESNSSATQNQDQFGGDAGGFTPFQ